MESNEPKTKYLEARNRANRNYYAKNKEKVKMMNYYSNSKTFINNTDDVDKLNELKILIDCRIKELGK